MWEEGSQKHYMEKEEEPDKMLYHRLCVSRHTVILVWQSMWMWIRLLNTVITVMNKPETCLFLSWPISWDYGTHSSNAHAQPSNGARCRVFGRTLRLLPYFMWANSEGSGETTRMRRLAWAFAGRLCDKYHNLVSWLIYQFKTFGSIISVNLWNYQLANPMQPQNN